MSKLPLNFFEGAISLARALHKAARSGILFASAFYCALRERETRFFGELQVLDMKTWHWKKAYRDAGGKIKKKGLGCVCTLTLHFFDFFFDCFEFFL